MKVPKIGDRFKMKYDKEIYTLYAISNTGKSYYTNKKKTMWFDISTIINNCKKIYPKDCDKSDK